MPAVVPRSIRGVAFRMGRHDDCDIPVTTPNRALAQTCFLKVGFNPDVEDGEEITVKCADDSLLIQDFGDDRIKGWEISLMIGYNDPAIVEMALENTSLLNEAGDTIGSMFPDFTREGRKDSLQFDAWARNADRSMCTVDGVPSRYVRYISPRAYNWMIDEGLDLENGGHQTIGLKGYSQANPNYFPILGLDPSVEEGSGNEGGTPPAGTAFDPDLNFEMVQAIRAAGGFGWIATNSLPTTSELGGYLF